MKLPDKFWFSNKSYGISEILFAKKMGNDYFLSNLKKETFVCSEHEAKEYFDLGYWVLTVPDEFCVRGLLTDTVYPVIKNRNGSYVLKNKVPGGSWRCYRHGEVLAWVYGVSPRWEIVENTSENFMVKPLQTNPCKKPEKKLISINVNDVRAAAEFDVANNPHTKTKGNTVEEIEQEIIEYLEKIYAALMSGDYEWKLRYTGTRTYRILFQPEDDSYGTISILSDTSVGMPTFFADVNDFLSQN